MAPGRVSESSDIPPYQGPLTSTFRHLKIFSLSSLALSFAVTPFMFIMESSLPLGARAALAATAITTSGLSTALISWCGNPYVVALRSFKSPDDPDIEGLEMTTLSILLRERVTRVYDSQFLVPTKRPFATWELAATTQFPVKGVTPGKEETIAETVDASGAILGRWIVKWGDDDRGTCRRVGKVVR